MLKIGPFFLQPDNLGVGLGQLPAHGAGAGGKLVVSTPADAPHLGGPRADHVLQLPSGEQAVDAMDTPVVAVGHALVVAHVEERQALTVIQGKGAAFVHVQARAGTQRQ